jgi:protocatechuate 3,4-dioxygenase beta subunit
MNRPSNDKVASGRKVSAHKSRVSKKPTSLAFKPSLEALDERVVPAAATGSISGHVLQDLTGNGPSSDDTGLGNVTVSLVRLSGGGSVVGSQPSASDGSYSFGNLTPGQYAVIESVPGGDVLTSPAGGVDVVQLKNGQQVTGQDFDNFQTPVTGNVTGISFTVTKPNGKSTTVTNLHGNTKQGDTITANFTVTGSSPVTLSLVSYNATSPHFNAHTASQDALLADSTGTFAPGQYSLTVQLPNNFYHVAFVVGAAIDHLGAPNSGISYSTQGRLLSADSGGAHGVQNGNLTGAVTDSSGNALAGTTVTVTNLANNDQTVVTTNRGGAYRLTGLQAGLPYSVTVSDANFASQTTQLTLARGGNTLNFALSSQLTSPATVSGFVTDTNGNALSGATVTVFQNGQPFTTTSLSDGSFIISSSGLVAGTDNFTVSDAGFTTLTGQVTLTGGSNSEDFTLAALPPELSGVATDTNGTTLFGATINVVDSTGATVATTTTAPDGSFSFNGIAAGTYTITASDLTGGGDTLLQDTVSNVALGTGSVNLNLTLS